jgi:hypothetical protein
MLAVFSTSDLLQAHPMRQRHELKKAKKIRSKGVAREELGAVILAEEDYQSYKGSLTIDQYGV